MQKKTSWLLSDLLIGSVISTIILILYLTQITFFEGLEFKLYDLRAKLRTAKKPSQEIVIVTIDDYSITNIGRWPWPRAIIAGLLQTISQFEPKVIGLNILFTDPDRNQGLEEIRNLKQSYFSLYTQIQKKLQKKDREMLLGFLQEMSDTEALLDNDTIMSETIATADNVILPMFFTVGKTLTSQITPTEQESVILSSNALVNVEAVSDASKDVDVLEGFLPVLPLNLFAEVSEGIGHANLVTDSDGVIRRESPVIYCNKKYYPSFAVQLVLHYLGLSIQDLKLKPGSELSFGRARIPLSSKSTMLIDFAGPPQTYPYYSVFDVLIGKIPKDVFKNKIVLVGYMATGLTELSVTPIGHNFPSAEITASAIGNILDQKFIERPEWAATFELVSLLVCSIFLCLLLPRLKAKFGAIVSFMLLAGIVTIGTYLFVTSGLWLKIFYSSSALILGYTVITSKRFLITEKRKELVEAESIETNKMLGLSFQGQGMLDLAFEKFRKCPIDDSVKELLYNLGLDFERKRQFNKAVAVYEHIQSQDQKYKDIADRIKMLKSAGETMIFGVGAVKRTKGETVILEGAQAQAPTLGRYEIVKELGQGAMGTVYLGKDPKINRMVAIKTVKFEDDIPEAELKSVKQRFFREAESAGNLSHPNIIRIYDAGEDFDLSYIAMELLDGNDLKRYCEKGNLLPVKDTIDIVMKVADALEYAHKQGVVHRDIKPANIMKLKDESIRVTDFGIARIVATSTTQTGTILGTPSYMSPEQIAGKKVDGRSDIFSLGVVLYELLTGEKPFKGDSIATLIYQISNASPPDPKSFRYEIPDCLINVVNKALQKNPDERYQTAREMYNDLKACLAV